MKNHSAGDPFKCPNLLKFIRNEEEYQLSVIIDCLLLVSENLHVDKASWG